MKWHDDNGLQRKRELSTLSSIVAPLSSVKCRLPFHKSQIWPPWIATALIDMDFVHWSILHCSPWPALWGWAEHHSDAYWNSQTYKGSLVTSRTGQRENFFEKCQNDFPLCQTKSQHPLWVWVLKMSVVPIWNHFVPQVIKCIWELKRRFCIARSEPYIACWQRWMCGYHWIRFALVLTYSAYIWARIRSCCSLLPLFCLNHSIFFWQA